MPACAGTAAAPVPVGVWRSPAIGWGKNLPIRSRKRTFADDKTVCSPVPVGVCPTPGICGCASTATYAGFLRKIKNPNAYAFRLLKLCDLSCTLKPAHKRKLSSSAYSAFLHRSPGSDASSQTSLFLSILLRLQGLSPFRLPCLTPDSG